MIFTFDRIFARVFLAYGTGPRSSPLDLLLYDSLCWDCTSGSGECKAKIGQTKCFFAAGTSSIQVFRIGRTIATRISDDHKGKIQYVLSICIYSLFIYVLSNNISDAEKRICTLPKDSGGCDNKIFRYYYNAIEVN